MRTRYALCRYCRSTIISLAFAEESGFRRAPLMKRKRIPRASGGSGLVRAFRIDLCTLPNIPFEISPLIAKAQFRLPLHLSSPITFASRLTFLMCTIAIPPKANGPMAPFATEGGVQQTCRLMMLPGELRNQIYRHVLCGNENLRVGGSGYKRPTFMLCCRQIRRETLAIYYQENRFKFVLYRWRCIGHERFCTALDAAEVQLPKTGHFVVLDKSPHWPNFRALIKHAHQRASRKHASDSGRVAKDQQSRCEKARRFERPHLLWTSQLIVAMAALPWEIVDRVLLTYRARLVKIDARWANDHENLAPKASAKAAAMI